jgi:hypothetical protein
MKHGLVFFATAAMLFATCATAQTTRNRNRNNLNINTQGDANSCADLKVTSTGELSQVNETVNLQHGEAPVLELNAADHGVVKVRGWKQPGYSVEACKVGVAEDRGTADTLVRGISVSHSAGRFSYTGPTTDNGNWQVFFIIHAPDNASLDLETKNAPVSIADVNGNIKVRATNGPLAIRGSAGNIDAQTTNGPISFDGDGGEVHLQAQNGPISVKVGKEIWNGTALEARTVNGPLSLSLPDTFQSGIRVETAGGSPLSCKHDACTHAYTNNTGDQHVIQMNGSSETVRISTHNGPLSVNGTSKAKKIL